MDSDLVGAIFAKHGVRGAWTALPATGLANRIYATRDVVLRVATDHPEAVTDARTESVAAPVAHAAGILTPRLIAFDDTRTLIDRPFSLWERVRGETLGLLELEHTRLAAVWRAVGRELFRLHQRVRVCSDPKGYLDTPERQMDLHPRLRSLVDTGCVNSAVADEIARLIDELAPHIATEPTPRFVHNDIHAMNLMCSEDGDLLALLDWGDAGWGDATLDFAAIPLDVIASAAEGYESQLPNALGEFPEARFIWDKLAHALEAPSAVRGLMPPVHEFRRFLLEGVRSHSPGGLTSE